MVKHETDYNRHLDEVARESCRLLFATLQELLVAEKTEDAIQLLQLWEAYLEVDQTKTQTMEEEYKLFLRKLSKLDILLENLNVQCDPSIKDTLRNLQLKLEGISQAVNREGSLNAGGKFEWVDSVLIKCLQEGSWLIIDNVNLCSAAVLDRLNGLLEPNGVLTISERGVSQDGQMVEVTPHPDFRLFLTMDPKNGEISRAMRNRGVEIFLLNDTETYFSNDFDVKSLIDNEGLSDPCHIECMLNLHKFMADLVLAEKPGICELLHCSSLITQQLNYGVNLEHAFFTSIIEVYYKTRPSIEFSCNDTLNVIKDEVERALHRKPTGLYHKNVTLKCSNIEHSSEVEKVNQQGAMLQTSKNENPVLVDHLSSHLLTITSHEDFQCRLQYISNNISELIDSDIKLPNVLKNYPVDSRWAPELPHTIKIPGWSNMMLLRENVKNLYRENIIEKPNCVSLHLMLKLAKQKKVESPFEHVVTDNYLELRKQFNKFVLNLCRNDRHLTDGELFNVIHLLQWSKYLSSLIESTDIKNIDQLSLYMLENKLTICYRWFYTHSVRQISDISLTKVHPKFENVLCNVNSIVNLKFSLMSKISENYQKTCEKPPPFKSQDHKNFCDSCRNICIKFDLYSEQNDEIAILNSFKAKSELRSTLIEIKIKEIECHLFGDISEVSNTIAYSENVKENLFSKHDLQLVPLIDYYSRLMLKRVLAFKKSSNSLTNCITIPTSLCGLLQKYEQTEDNKLMYEIVTAYYQYLENCPSTTPSKFVSGPEIEDFNITLNEYSPFVTYFTTNLLVKLDNTGVTTLGNFRLTRRQHRHLGLLLWRNLYQLYDSEYNSFNLECEILKESLSIFLCELTRCFKANDNNPSFANAITYINEFKTNSPLQDVNDETNDLIARISLLQKLSDDAFGKVQNKEYFCARLYLLLGYIKMLLNGKLPLIDPLVRKELKCEILALSISLFATIKTSYELQNKLYSSTDETLHPHHGVACKMLETLENQHRELANHVASRERGKVNYKNVYQQITHSMTTIFSSTVVDNINKSLEKLQSKIDSGNVDPLSTKDFVRINQAIPNYQHFLNECHVKFTSSYPDIVWPVVGATSEFIHGVKSSVAVLIRNTFNTNIKAKFDIDSPDLEMVKLVILPSLYEGQSSYEMQIEAYTSKTLHNFINDMLLDKELPVIAKQENYRLLKCAIQESFNNCLIDAKTSEVLNKNLFNQFCQLVDKFVSSWNKQQEEKEKAEQEAESLYKTRTKCESKSETEEIEDELKELFPNFHSIDFFDMQEKKLDDSSVEKEKPAEEFSGIISYEDLKFVVNLHTTLLQNYTKTEWLNPKPSKNINCDFVRPVIEKYKVFKRILDKKLEGFSDVLDKSLLPSLNVLRTVVENYGEYSVIKDVQSPTRIIRKKDKDFYKDSDVDEVKSCYYIIEELRLKVKELLNEWPDHPTLKTISDIIERINGFDITSPISRFLTGLEILLTKCHEWEQVAHSGVSLNQYSQNLTQQIITWRKLELSMWKDLLSRTFGKLNEPLSKWWLYLYNILKQFVLGRTIPETDLIEILQNFITKSSLAEFQGRLDMIYAFHCHATYLESTNETKGFINILWNIYCYFQQFEGVIANKIKDLRTPIEKKLRDYVKIVRWKDVNYWAIKDTVEKSHKTLHKFIREFKETLQQPVSPYLVNIPSVDNKNVGIWDRPQRQSPKTYHYTLDPDSYIIKHPLPKKEENAELESEFSEFRKLNKEIIERTNYPSLIQSLDGFVTELIETSTHLQNLEVDTNLPKEKQKSQAKSILNRKHRALADLFKSLSKIGLSFRTGIVKSKVRKPTDDFTLKPIDLAANFSHITSVRSDEKILTIWESCEDFYYKTLIRSDVLETAMKSPAQDLGPQNLERCKGFAAHFISFAQQQKIQLVQFSRRHYYMRYYLKQLQEWCKGGSYCSVDTIDKIRDYLKNISIVMNQYKIILNSCPEEESFGDDVIEVPLLESDIQTERIQFKNDAIWNKAARLVDETNSISYKLSTVLKKSKGDIPYFDVDLILHQYVVAPEIQDDMESIKSNLSDLKQLFENTNLAESLVWLNKFEFATLSNTTQGSASEKGYKLNVNNLHEKLTSTVEKLHDKYRDFLDRTQEEIDQNGLQEGHLKNLLVENLMEDIEIFDIPRLLTLIENVACSTFSISPNGSENYRTILTPCLALLEQVIQLHQYFFTQQVSAYRITCKLSSILLNVFIELVSKGFCVPPELSGETDDEGVGKPSDGMGLGEGQGERDVSDRIESEDQLDDAQPAGQEKEKQEDPDYKEEDNGIEMSEDFDSKLQDKEKKEGDDSDNESSNSDAEEQMGETEKGADQMNKEAFADEEKEDEGVDESEEKEEKGEGGEKDGEEQLAAGEDKKSKDDPTEKPDKSSEEEKEKSKKEINQMEEPEYDDEQTDPYHGNQPELPEPEAMDLPDDLQLDEGEEKDAEEQEDNPFDIDTMKDQTVPEDKPEEEQETKVDGENDEEKNFSSDDEEITHQEGDDRDDLKNEDNADQSPKNEENKTEEVEDEESSNENLQQSNLDQTETNQDNVEAMETDQANTADKTQPSQSQNQKSNEPIDELCQEDKPDKEGVGQSQMEESQTGHTAPTSMPQDVQGSKRDREDDVLKKQKPGESDSQRSLGDVNEPVSKKLKTVDAKDDSTQDENIPDEKESAEIYQHIKEAKEQKTTQILDAATKEQAEKQTIQGKEEEEEETTEASKDLPEEEDEINVDDQDTQVDKPEKTANVKDKKTHKQQHPEGDILEDVRDIDVEGEVIQTSTVSRPAETTHHTQYDDIRQLTAQRLTVQEINSLRFEVEKQLASWNDPPSSGEAEEAWQKIISVTLPLAQDLSEQLRLVLEPTQASRLKGDFRTGRRINMRKVIPYIASQFRKDKIWLRRTKPSKREYQIVLAIDDSSSMADNRSKELAFESVALISKALTLLESGQLSVVSFGENVEVLHKLTDQFTDRSGVKLLQKFKFDQQKTYVAKLVDFTTEMFNQTQTQSSALIAKLLIIVSDGRGVFSEGETYVKQAVRRAKLANIFMVFVIIDNPENKNSVLDIRMPVFKDGKLLRIDNYMDVFPFSFYIILRDLSSLPSVLSDALRQWFEVVSNLDKQ